MAESARQQEILRTTHAVIVALIQAYGQYKKYYKTDSNQPCRTGTEKGMECCDGRGQRSIDDFAKCGGPKEKLAMSSCLWFLLINI